MCQLASLQRGGIGPVGLGARGMPKRQQPCVERQQFPQASLCPWLSLCQRGGPRGLPASPGGEAGFAQESEDGGDAAVLLGFGG